MKPRNIGWKCGLCKFKSMTMPGASDRVMQHIKIQHPENWKTGDWNMISIKPGDPEEETEPPAFVN